MADNFQKTWLANSLNQVAIARAGDAIQITGKALPCAVVSKNGSIVTVSFQVNAAPITLVNVTVPIFGPEYIRYPVQPGCKGVVFPADVALGGVTGLGSGQPKLTDVPNLTALVFFPLGNTNFNSVDPDQLVLYGEPAALIQDKTGASKGLFDTSGITLTSNGHTLTIDAGGVTIDGRVFLTHEHSGVATGSGVTGGVV